MVFLATLSTGAHAGPSELDQGVAATLFCAERCDSSDIPVQVLRMAEAWQHSRSYEVETGMDDLCVS